MQHSSRIFERFLIFFNKPMSTGYSGGPRRVWVVGIENGGGGGEGLSVTSKLLRK